MAETSTLKGLHTLCLSHQEIDLLYPSIKFAVAWSDYTENVHGPIWREPEDTTSFFQRTSHQLTVLKIHGSFYAHFRGLCKPKYLSQFPFLRLLECAVSILVYKKEHATEPDIVLSIQHLIIRAETDTELNRDRRYANAKGDDSLMVLPDMPRLATLVVRDEDVFARKMFGPALRDLTLVVDNFTRFCYKRWWPYRRPLLQGQLDIRSGLLPNLERLTLEVHSEITEKLFEMETWSVAPMREQLTSLQTKLKKLQSVTITEL